MDDWVVAPQTRARFLRKTNQLYEQGRHTSAGRYQKRWVGWAKGGLKGLVSDMQSILLVGLGAGVGSSAKYVGKIPDDFGF